MTTHVAGSHHHRRRPIRRAVILLPSGLTIANLFFGIFAIVAAARGDPSRAGLYVVLAGIFDVFDGRVARATNTGTPLGSELDSLVDIVSFGVAPAAIGFAVGLRGGWDVIPLLFLVACAIGRLARYNVTSAALADESGKVRYFEGIPVTGSLLVVAVLAASVLTGHLGDRLPLGAHQLGPFVLHPLALAYVAVGCGMVSKRLHIPKP